MISSDDEIDSLYFTKAEMTFQEKTLYHQIHPLKLLTDWSMGIIALVLFWQHALFAALAVAFIPSILVSLALVRLADLGTYKQSRFGQYVHKYMTRSMEALRLAGYAVMAVGAWLHLAWLIPLGLVTILFGWLRGAIFPDRSSKRSK
jgi:hypothetical protein